MRILWWDSKVQFSGVIPWWNSLEGFYGEYMRIWEFSGGILWCKSLEGFYEGIWEYETMGI